MSRQNVSTILHKSDVKLKDNVKRSIAQGQEMYLCLKACRHAAAEAQPGVCLTYAPQRLSDMEVKGVFQVDCGACIRMDQTHQVDNGACAADVFVHHQLRGRRNTTCSLPE